MAISRPGSRELGTRRSTTSAAISTSASSVRLTIQASGTCACDGCACRQNVIEIKCRDGFNHAGKHESKGQNQREPVMRAAESHHGIGRVGEAQQAADKLQVGIQDGFGRKRKLAEPRGPGNRSNHPERLRKPIGDASTSLEFATEDCTAPPVEQSQRL